MVLGCKGTKRKHQALGAAGRKLQATNAVWPCELCGLMLPWGLGGKVVQPGDECTKRIAFHGLLYGPQTIDGRLGIDHQHLA